MHTHLLLHTVQAQGPSLAVCYSGTGCTGNDLGVIEPRDCCVGTPAGSAYRTQGSEICVPCIGERNRRINDVTDELVMSSCLINEVLAIALVSLCMRIPGNLAVQ